MSRELFYDAKHFGIVPMGFCYPGKGKSGDLPPRPECSEKWIQPVLNYIKDVQLKIIIGKYAMAYFLEAESAGVTEIVKQWKSFLPSMVVLPHPSPRNNIWLKKNAWFEKNLVPHLRRKVQAIIGDI